MNKKFILKIFIIFSFLGVSIYFCHARICNKKDIKELSTLEISKIYGSSSCGYCDSASECPREAPSDAKGINNENDCHALSGIQKCYDINTYLLCLSNDSSPFHCENGSGGEACYKRTFAYVWHGEFAILDEPPCERNGFNDPNGTPLPYPCAWDCLEF